MNPCEELGVKIRQPSEMPASNALLFPTRIANAAPCERRVDLRRSCATSGILHPQDGFVQPSIRRVRTRRVGWFTVVRTKYRRTGLFARAVANASTAAALRPSRRAAPRHATANAGCRATREPLRSDPHRLLQ